MSDLQFHLIDAHKKVHAGYRNRANALMIAKKRDDLLLIDTEAVLPEDRVLFVPKALRDAFNAIAEAAR